MKKLITLAEAVQEMKPGDYFKPEDGSSFLNFYLADNGALTFENCDPIDLHKDHFFVKGEIIKPEPREKTVNEMFVEYSGFPVKTENGGYPAEFSYAYHTFLAGVEAERKNSEIRHRERFSFKDYFEGQVDEETRFQIGYNNARDIWNACLKSRGFK